MTENSDYGNVIVEVTVDPDDQHPGRVSVIEQRGKMWLDIRKMYHDKEGKLQYGKGVRLEIDNGFAEDMILAAQQVLGQVLVDE